MNKHLGKFSACLTLLVAVRAFGIANAQELRGRIVGVVSDNTGGVLPGVTVTATSPALIQAQVTFTGADGSYRFPALPPGLYRVSYELPGFQTLVRDEAYTKLLGPMKWVYFHLYVMLDIFSRYVVGWMVAEHESAALAKRLIE